MTVTLAPDLEENVNRKIADGEYASVGELSSEALRLLISQQLDDEPLDDEICDEVATGLGGG